MGFKIGYFVYPLHEQFGGGEIRAIEFEEKYNELYKNKDEKSIHIRRVKDSSDLENLNAIIIYGGHYKNHSLVEYIKNHTDIIIIVSSIFVKHTHNIFYYILSKIGKPKTTVRLTYEIYEKADYIFTNSIYEKNQLYKAFDIDKQKISVLPNMIDYSFIDEFKNKYNENVKKSNFINIGRIEPIKNQIFLMETILKYNIDINITFVGNINYTNKKYINKFNQYINKYPKKFKHENRVSKEKLYKMILNSKALIVSSKFETTGRVALESYLLGVPVISSNIPTLKEYLEHKDNVLFFKNNSKKDFLKTINKFLEENNTILKNDMDVKFRYSKGLKLYNDFFVDILNNDY